MQTSHPRHHSLALPSERYPAAPKRSEHTAIRALWNAPPAVGEATEIVAGLWLLSLPIGRALDRVNIYILEDGDGWTVVDTGINKADCRQAVEAAFACEPLNRLPITRVIVTHFHPDHIGLAGWFCQNGAALYTSRTCWMQTRILNLSQSDTPLEHELDFVAKAGMKGLELEALRRRPYTDYGQTVLPIPYSYHRLQQGDSLTIGDRIWTIQMGNGHAPEQVTLWSDDGYVLAGDQLLLGISANISVLPTEPEEDVLAEWIESCERFAALATNEMLCLPGHNVPFYGIRSRCHQQVESHERVLARLLPHLRQPRTVLDCLDVVYRRKLQSFERGILIAETFGYLNHLYRKGFVDRKVNFDDAYLWSTN